MIFCSEKCARSWENENIKKKLANQRASFISESLEKLPGWNLLSEEEKQNFIRQVNNSKIKQFNEIYQQAQKLIREKQNNNQTKESGDWEGNENDFSNNDNQNNDSESDSNSNSSDGEDGMPEKYKEIARSSLAQSKQKSEQKIENILKGSGVTTQELNQKIWSGKSNWKEYLNQLDTPQKVAKFAYQMEQAILAKAWEKHTKSLTKMKKTEKDWILPVAISVVSFLALTSLVLILRKRRRRRF
jgi:hypothetical protein